MTYVYESPDGGKTVYKRKVGTTQRAVVNSDTTPTWWKWQDIFKQAKTNPALQDALDQVQIIYELSKSYES